MFCFLCFFFNEEKRSKEKKARRMRTYTQREASRESGYACGFGKRKKTKNRGRSERCVFVVLDDAFSLSRKMREKKNEGKTPTSFFVYLVSSENFSQNTFFIFLLPDFFSFPNQPAFFSQRKKQTKKQQQWCASSVSPSLPSLSALLPRARRRWR